jgi:hypothetical protein
MTQYNTTRHPLTLKVCGCAVVLLTRVVGRSSETRDSEHQMHSIHDRFPALAGRSRL